ncbi:MAG: hypothetical protein WD207_02515 [Xanthobacteraceae bacterium]
MREYIPPPTPKQIAELRRRQIKAAIWIGAIPLLVFVLMVFGYSDAAPDWMRRATIELDSFLGSPIWSLLDPRGGK